MKWFIYSYNMTKFLDQTPEVTVDPVEFLIKERWIKDKESVRREGNMIYDRQGNHLFSLEQIDL